MGESRPQGPTLRTPRLVLRPFRAGDIVAAAACQSDAEWVRYLALDFPEAEAFVEAGMTLDWERECAFAMELAGDVVGFVLLGRQGTSLVGELACLVRPPDWRKGLAVEACRAVIQYGFDRLGLEKVSARADARNVGSIRAMERLGMRCEGLLRAQRTSRGGRRVDEVVYGLARPEWEGRPA